MTENCSQSFFVYFLALPQKINSRVRIHVYIVLLSNDKALGKIRVKCSGACREEKAPRIYQFYNTFSNFR